MHSGIVTFTVSGGQVSNLTSPNTAAGLIDAYSTTENSKTNEHFVFENTAGTELPGTGQSFGLSRMGFAGMGTILLIGFTILYLYKRRQNMFTQDDGDEEI